MFGVKALRGLEALLRLAPGASPVTIKTLQLPLYSAADAAAVAAVQPVAHHAQAVVPLLPVKCKVLYFGGNALAALGPGNWGSAAVFFSVGDKSSQPGDPARVQQGRSLAEDHWALKRPHRYSQRDLHSIWGNWGGGARDTSEVAGRERGRLKHIVRHGAHLFLNGEASQAV